MIPPEVNLTKTLFRITYLGLFMNVLMPIGIFIAAAFLREENLQNGAGLDIPRDGTLQIFFYAFLAVSVVDAAITYFIRKKYPEKFLRVEGGSLDERFGRAALRISVIIFSFNLSYSIYGLVLLILGSEIEVMMLFMAFSLITYQVFRPRQKYLERLIFIISGKSRNGDLTA